MHPSIHTYIYRYNIYKSYNIIYIYIYICHVSESDVSGSHDTLKCHPSRIGNQKPIRDVRPGRETLGSKTWCRGLSSDHGMNYSVRCRKYPPFEDNFPVETMAFPRLCKPLGYMCQIAKVKIRVNCSP